MPRRKAPSNRPAPDFASGLDADYGCRARGFLERKVIGLIFKVCGESLSRNYREFMDDLADRGADPTLDAFLAVNQNFPLLISMEKLDGKLERRFLPLLLTSPSKAQLDRLWASAEERLGASDTSRPLAIIPYGRFTGMQTVEKWLVVHGGRALSRSTSHGILYVPAAEVLLGGERSTFRPRQWPQDGYLCIEPLLPLLEALPAGYT